MNINISYKMRKIVSIVSIACVSVAAAIGIALILNMPFFKGLAQILFSLLTFFGVSIFSLNTVEALNRKNKLGYAAEILILLSGLVFLIGIWGELFKDFPMLYWKIATVIGCISVLVSVILSKSVLLKKNLLVVQIIGYATLAYVLVVVCSLVWGSTVLFKGSATTALVIDIIVCIVMYIVISIRAKLEAAKEPVANTNDEMITITKEEYESLQNRIKELEEKLANN